MLIFFDSVFYTVMWGDPFFFLKTRLSFVVDLISDSLVFASYPEVYRWHIVPGVNFVIWIEQKDTA